MVDNPSIEETGKSENDKLIPGPPAPPVGVISSIEEEKVEVLIKESILINPRDFSAFKHALEGFVAEWDQ